MKPVVPVEQFADLPFPDQGVDLALGFAMQRDGTTRSGQNVRSYEPAQQRERGGSRQGLKQYVPDLVGGVHLVQHLNYVVDPEAFGFVDYDPPGGVTGGDNPSGGGPTGDGTYPDPTGPPRVTVPRTIRFGGTGLTLSKRRKPKADILFLQGNSVSAGGVTVSTPYPGPVAAGNLLVAVAYQVNAAPGAAVVLTGGNAWTQLGAYSERLESGNYYSLSLWWAVAAATGAETVISTGPGSFQGLGVYEYQNADPASPPDGNGQDSGAGGGTSAVAAGTAAVSLAGDMAFVAVVNRLAGGFGGQIVIEDVGATDAVAGGTFVNLFAWDYIPVASAFTFLGHSSGGGPFSPWLAVAGTFKKAP